MNRFKRTSALILIAASVLVAGCKTDKVTGGSSSPVRVEFPTNPPSSKTHLLIDCCRAETVEDVVLCAQLKQNPNMAMETATQYIQGFCDVAF